MHRPFHPPQRLLLGPGPSAVASRVLEALGRPTIGHLDPEYLRLMDATGELLRQVFRTSNALTLAVSGTGSAGMEACVVNLVEPGDRVIIGVNGVFGTRMADVARRCGADVVTVEAPWGEVFEPDQISEALESGPAPKLLGIVHAETSTGAHQPLEEISRRVHEAGALLLVDAVTSLGGIDLRVDDWRIDACYSGTQKCLSCPPGLSPVTFSPAALETLSARRTPVQSWYLDLTMIQKYWGSERVYHHTGPINMSYALHEALCLVLEEGLGARFARHALNHRALVAGLEALELELIPSRSLTTLNAVRVPAGVDEANIRRRLLHELGIEIGAGLGPFQGKAWRIGLMGDSSRERNVLQVLAGLEYLLRDEGHDPSGADPRAAAGAVYAAARSDP